MGIKSTYAWSARLVARKLVLRAHPLASMAPRKSCQLRLCTKPVGGKDEIDDADGEPWRTAYRTKTPEQLGVRLGTLSRAWSQLKPLALELAPRRKPWAEKCRGFLRTARRKQELTRAARDRLAAKRAALENLAGPGDASL